MKKALRWEMSAPKSETEKKIKELNVEYLR